MFQFAREYVLLLAVAVAGCDASADLPKYEVEGTVTCKKELVRNGTVLFQPDSGPAIVGAISKDGNYRILAPEGSYRIGVAAMPEIPADVDPWQRGVQLPPALIPAKYERPETSGILLEVAGGRQSFDINIP